MKQSIVDQYEEIALMSHDLDVELGNVKPSCADGLEPHEYEVNDFSPDQADLRCRNCGKIKWL